MKIKRLYAVAVAILAVCALASSSRAQTTIVSNTFNEANRLYPGIPPYSEDGVVNSEGDIESEFIRGGSGTITVEAPGPGYGAPVAGQANVLVGNGEGANSASWYTYFTPTNIPPSQTTDGVTLANPGDEMILTWQFTPVGVAALNNNQGLTLAVAETPAGGQSAGDASIPNNVYTGFSMFMNMGTTLSNNAPFQLKRWGLGATSSALLGSSGNWTSLSNGAVQVSTGTKGATGYTSGTQYTLTMTLELDPSGDGDLDVTSTIKGDSLNNVGSMSVSYVDTAPTTDGAGLSFDTFDIRPGNTNTTANEFDTSLFEVQLQTVPEPSTMLLVVAGLGMMIGLARRYRRH